MINVQYANLERILRDKIQDASLYRKIISVCLGVSVARLAPLPSSSVQYAEDHYTQQTSHTVDTLVSTFANNMAIQRDLAVAVARCYWMIRYSCAYPDLTIPLKSSGEMTFLQRFTRAGVFSIPEADAVLNQYSQICSILINNITGLLKPQED